MAKVTVIIGYERFEAEITEQNTRTMGEVLTTDISFKFRGADTLRLTQAVEEYPPAIHGMKIEGTKK